MAANSRQLGGAIKVKPCIHQLQQYVTITLAPIAYNKYVKD